MESLRRPLPLAETPFGYTPRGQLTHNRNGAWQEDISSVPASPRRFPAVKALDDDHEEHLTPRRVMASLESFSLMMQHGAGLGDALHAALTGKLMTPAQAAICVQTFWRRYSASLHWEAQLAAVHTIQHAYRMFVWRRLLAAVLRIQACRRGHVARREVGSRLSKFRAARTLQNAWRQRRARRAAARLRLAKQGKVGIKRSFSWTRKRRTSLMATARSDSTSGKGATAAVPPGGTLRRALSFDRVPRTVQPNHDAAACAGTSPEGAPRDASNASNNSSLSSTPRDGSRAPRKVRRSSSFGRAAAATARGTTHAASATARAAGNVLQPTRMSLLLHSAFGSAGADRASTAGPLPNYHATPRTAGFVGM